MKTVQCSIELRADVGDIFRAWTDFERFPKFMKNIREVRVLDEQRQSWTAEVHGQLVQWESMITVVLPNRRIAWRVLDGDAASGAVTMEQDGLLTRLTLQFTYSPTAPWAAMDESEVEASTAADLEQFKALFETEPTAGQLAPAAAGEHDGG